VKDVDAMEDEVFGRRKGGEAKERDGLDKSFLPSFHAKLGMNAFFSFV
jgi:hypothetical protein